MKLLPPLSNCFTNSQSCHYFSMCLGFSNHELAAYRKKSTPTPSLCSWDPCTISASTHTKSHGTGSRGHQTHPDNPQEEEPSPKRRRVNLKSLVLPSKLSKHKFFGTSLQGRTQGFRNTRTN